MRHWILVSTMIMVVAAVIGLARWTFAQQAPPQQTPVVISGSDIGFRVDRNKTQQVGKLTGSWVVRVNGQWVEPETSTSRNLVASAR